MINQGRTENVELRRRHSPRPGVVRLYDLYRVPTHSFTLESVTRPVLLREQILISTLSPEIFRSLLVVAPLAPILHCTRRGASACPREPITSRIRKSAFFNVGVALLRIRRARNPKTVVAGEIMTRAKKR